jgi:hypothetical protein
MSDKALAKILKAVGAEHVPSTLDPRQLKTDIYTAWRFYSDHMRGTQGGPRNKLQRYADKVRKAGHELEKILNQESWEARIFRHHRLSYEQFSLNSFRIQLACFSKLAATFEMLHRKGSARQRRKTLSLSTTDWVFGFYLPTIFAKHFKQKATRNRQPDKTVDSPYIRFAVAVSKSPGWDELRPETVSKAMTEAPKAGYGQTKKPRLKTSKNWHQDSQGNWTRVLENS